MKMINTDTIFIFKYIFVKKKIGAPRWFTAPHLVFQNLRIALKIFSSTRMQPIGAATCWLEPTTIQNMPPNRAIHNPCFAMLTIRATNVCWTHLASPQSALLAQTVLGNHEPLPFLSP